MCRVWPRDLAPVVKELRLNKSSCYTELKRIGLAFILYIYRVSHILSGEF